MWLSPGKPTRRAVTTLGSNDLIESVVANSFVPSDFLVDGQVSGLGIVHPLLTLDFVSTWVLPLHVVSSTLKMKSSSSVVDGLQRRKEDGYCHTHCFLKYR